MTNDEALYPSDLAVLAVLVCGSEKPYKAGMGIAAIQLTGHSRWCATIGRKSLTPDSGNLLTDSRFSCGGSNSLGTTWTAWIYAGRLSGVVFGGWKGVKSDGAARYWRRHGVDARFRL